MDNLVKLTREFLATILDSVSGKGTYTLSVEAEEYEPLPEKKLEGKQYVRVDVKVSGDELELLIGFHGQTLKSLHHIVKTYLSKQFGEYYISLNLDIADYISQKEERLLLLVKEAVEEVKLLESAYEFRPMNSKLRRLIHLEVKKYEGVKSESEGEGKERHVVIKLAN